MNTKKKSYDGVARVFDLLRGGDMRRWGPDQRTLFKNLKDNPNLSRAEAFRRSMMSLASVPETSHPFFWAPFSGVGEGR